MELLYASLENHREEQKFDSRRLFTILDSKKCLGSGIFRSANIGGDGATVFELGG